MNFDVKKATQVINLFLMLKWSYLDKLSILKLIWLADRLHLRKYWKTITNDSYFAMEMWPVASWIKYVFDLDEEALNNEEIEYVQTFLKKFSYKATSKKDVDFSLLSDSDVEIIKLVYADFWNHNSSKLIDITHKYPEWKKFENDVNNWKIAQMDYIDFFDNTPEQDSIFDISEEDLEITKDIYMENMTLDKLLF